MRNGSLESDFTKSVLKITFTGMKMKMKARIRFENCRVINLIDAAPLIDSQSEHEQQPNSPWEGVLQLQNCRRTTQCLVILEPETTLDEELVSNAQ